MRMSSAVVLLGLIAGGCAATTINDPGVVCTAIAVSSLNVTVRDAVTGQRVCDALVVAFQGTDRYELQPMGECSYAGPWERAGTFEVAVTRTGYAPARMAGIGVTADQCHVIPVQLTVDVHPY